MKKHSSSLIRKEVVLSAVLLILLLYGVFLAVSHGSWEIQTGHVWRILLMKLGLFSGEVGEVETAIIWDGRIPRLLVALLAGFALAGAGCIMQGIFKNPMASPGVIGISSGAALGAVVSIYLGLAAWSLIALPLLAIMSAALTLVIVFAIATSGGHTSISTLLLAGIALNLILGALTSFVVTLSTREFDVGRVIVTWLMGDLNNRSWEHVYIVFVTTAAAFFGSMFFAKDLNILMIDEETAVNLGVNVKLARTALLSFASILTGGAIAVSGVIGFVGLIAPHIIRGLIGPDNRKLLPLSGLLGAVIIIYADLFVRLVVKVDLRIGILTSLLGGPFFLYLLIRHGKRFEYM
jgi:iron complex transport system permease protein